MSYLELMLNEILDEFISDCHEKKIEITSVQREEGTIIIKHNIKEGKQADNVVSLF